MAATKVIASTEERPVVTPIETIKQLLQQVMNAELWTENERGGMPPIYQSYVHILLQRAFLRGYLAGLEWARRHAASDQQRTTR